MILPTSKKTFRDRGILNHPKLFIQSALLVDYIHSNASTEVKNKYDIENDLKCDVNENLNTDKQKNEENYRTVKSPMVGTFYTKSSPTAEPFVKVGDRVKKGDVLCIIEAMKLMNEIESDVDGEIVEICYNDEDLVEYGSVLFKIK